MAIKTMKTFLTTLFLLISFSMGYSQYEAPKDYSPTIVDTTVNVPLLQQASIHLVKGQRLQNGAIAAYVTSSLIGGSLLGSSLTPNSHRDSFDKQGVVIGSVIMGAGAITGFILHLSGNLQKSKGFQLMGNGFGVRF